MSKDKKVRGKSSLGHVLGILKFWSFTCTSTARVSQQKSEKNSFIILIVNWGKQNHFSNSSVQINSEYNKTKGNRKNKTKQNIISPKSERGRCFQIQIIGRK